MPIPRDPGAKSCGPLRLRVRPDARAQPNGRERLSADRIVEVAIEQMRTVGYDAVSMRSVAKALGTGPASLYAHVASREELDQLVVQRVAREVPVPEPDPDRWEEQVKELLADTLAAYRRHPGCARASLGMVPTEVGVLRYAEALMSLCLAGGVPVQVAAWFCDLASLYVGAVAIEEAIWSERGGLGDPESMAKSVAELRETFAGLPCETFPVLSAHACEMTAGDGDERLAFALDLLLEGLKALGRRDASQRA